MPKLNFIREQPLIRRKVFDPDHSHWQYRYVIEFSPNTKVRSDRVYDSHVGALAAGRLFIKNYCK